MLNLPSLREARSAKADAIRSIISKAETEKRDLTEQEQGAFDGIKTEIAKIEQNIRNAEVVADLERRMDGTPVTNADGRFETECRQFSLRKAIAAQIGMEIDCGREREISTELARRNGRPAQGIWCPTNVFEKRVITTTTPIGGPGNSITPINWYGDQYVDLLRAQTAIGRLGARIFTGLTGDFAAPKLTKGTATYWVGENAALTPSDAEFNPVLMRPKHVGCLTEVSRNMIMQSSPAVEDLLRDDFAQQLAGAMDIAAINGAGSASDQPLGILKYPDVGDVPGGAAGLAPSYANIVALTTKVKNANAPNSSLGFLTNTKVIAKCSNVLKSTSDTSSNFICSPGASTLLDFPLVVSNNMPSNLVKGGSGAVCSGIIFGAWSELLVGYWSSFDLLANPYDSTAYPKGNILLRGFLTADIVLRHAESFAKTDDVLTT